MAITVQDVRHLAKLAALALNDQQLGVMTEELGHIVGYVQQLQAVDTKGIAPVASVGHQGGVSRADVAGPMLSQAEVLTLAPSRGVDAILVPKVVER